jgi:hypothetical protein
MKKLIFANNEEKKIIRHLHESAKKGIVIKEQGYTKDNSGMIGKDALGNSLIYQGVPGWNRDNDGPLGYWKILFNELNAHGIPVKWESDNSPLIKKLGGDDANYMFWDGWVIWKDLTKNEGYPVSFTDSLTNVSTTFKFNGGRYKGQPADKIILDAKSINLTFNLGQFGKYDKKTMSELITKYLKSNPKGKWLSWAGVTDSPLDTDKSEEVDDNSSMISDVSIGQRDASDITYKPKKVSRPPNPIVTELQTNLNVKFSSGLVEDGYLGQKTRNAIYDALTKGPQQTITVPQPVTVGAGTPNDDN